MKGFYPLLKKEILGQLRTYRFLIVGGIFLFFGISTPITIKYLPEIIKASAGGMSIEVPPPTAIQSLAEFAGTIGQIGVLVAVLVAMGAIANELKNGTALLMLSKPISRSAFVGAKFIALSITFLASLAVSGLLCFGYTVWIIEGSSFIDFMGLSLLLGLFLVFCLAVTLLFSSLFKSSLAAGGLALLTIIVLAIFSTFPYVGAYLPGKMLDWGSNLLAGSGDSYWWALAVTVFLTGICLYLSQRTLKNKEM